jgi:hypothetical protein
MTDVETDEQTAVTPAPQFDAFAAVMALVQLAVDPKAVEARLAELKTALAKLERATKELSRREIHFNADMARRQAELAEAAEVARRRQLAAIEAESKLEAAQAEIAEFRRTRDARRDFGRYEPLPGGGVREYVPGQPRGDVFDAPPVRSEPVEETEIERVPGSAHTLTRSVPKKRSMRRIADHA